MKKQGNKKRGTKRRADAKSSANRQSGVRHGGKQHGGRQRGEKRVEKRCDGGGQADGRRRNGERRAGECSTGAWRDDKQRAGSVESKCPVSAKCGGCSRIDVPYADQLAEKQQFVARLFEDVAPEDAVVEPVLGMENPYHYRAKVASPFAPGRKLSEGGGSGYGTSDSAQGRDACGDGRQDGGARAAGGRFGKDGRPCKGKDAHRGRTVASRREILTGMYAAHSHRLVPTDECLLENRQAKAVILAIRDLMYRFDMAPYNEDTGAGFMRHAVVRVAHKSGEVLVTVVTNAREFPASRSFCRELVKRCPFVTTVVQNVNLRQTNVILGDEERTLYGPGFILDTLCGLSFRVSSKSFYQVNAVQTEVLYRRAIELARLTGKETVIDAYCGTGTIGLVAAKNGAARVFGVDSVAAAIRDARQNARHNGVENAEFVVADAGDFMRDFAARNVSHETLSDTVLFMDPPRAGASREFLDAVRALAPARIVYISCNPETQARDAAYLVHAGYFARRLQPVDMFPHTDHIECIALIERE